MNHQTGRVRWPLLVISVVVLTVTGATLWWAQRSSWDIGALWTARTAPFEQSLADMGQSIERVMERVNELDQQLVNHHSQLAAQGQVIEDSQAMMARAIEGEQRRARQSVAEAMTAIDAMQDRIAQMQAEQDEVIDALRERGQALPQVDRSVMRRLALVEASALLSLGQQRLELANDPAGAVALYRQAAAALAALDEVRLGPVLRQIQREQAEIEALPNVDWALWQSRVLQLQASVRHLAGESTAAQDRQDSATSGLAAEEIDRRSWRERVQQGVGALVTVRPREAAESAAIDHRLRQQQLNVWLDTVLLALYQQDAELTRQAASRARALWPGAADSEASNWLVALEGLREPSHPIELGLALQRLRAELEGSP